MEPYRCNSLIDDGTLTSLKPKSYAKLTTSLVTSRTLTGYANFREIVERLARIPTGVEENVEMAPLMGGAQQPYREFLGVILNEVADSGCAFGESSRLPLFTVADYWCSLMM